MIASTVLRLAIASVSSSMALTFGTIAEAGQPPALPIPMAAATPTAPPQAADPCGGNARLLATLNRPTIGFSVCAVPPGSVVLEEGYQINVRRGPDTGVAVQYPQGFERLGLSPRLELDIVGPNLNRSRSSAGDSRGLSDMGLGFKYEFAPKGRFTYAVDGLLTAPTGSGGFSAGGPTQTLNLDISYALTPAIALGTTLSGLAGGGVRADGSLGRFAAFDPSLVITAQMPNAYQFYAELAGQSRVSPDEGGRAFVDFGVQKLIGPCFELDLEEGIGFTPVQGSRFTYTGLGFGVRLR
ncbi:MAG: hypothetical protein KGM44_11430 [bacterium]|nr:hypothetical protein [bacterium]